MISCAHVKGESFPGAITEKMLWRTLAIRYCLVLLMSSVSYRATKAYGCIYTLDNDCAFYRPNKQPVKLSYQYNYISIFYDEPSKLDLVCDQSSSVCLCMQDYEPLRVVVMTYATLVNTQTHIDRQLAPSYTIS